MLLVICVRIKMKVLIVNKFLHANGGSETYIIKVGQQFKKLGHEVQYFGMEHPGRVLKNDWDCYTSNMDFHNSKLAKLAYPFKIIYSREAYKKIMYVLRQFDPDVVHLNNFNFQLTPSVLYAIKKYGKKRGRKLPIVMTAHDSQLVCPNHLMTIPSNGEICFACKGGKFGNCTKNKCIHNSKVKSLLATIEGFVYRGLKTYRLIDLLVCPSDFLREKMATNPILEKKAITLHNFVEAVGELEGEKAAESHKSVEDKGSYILYFGRYSKEKGIESLLKICEKLPDIPFVFAGSGPLREAVLKVKNIEERGFLQGDALYQTIAGASLVLFPSECNENCPFSVMEAQIYGTPVLGSRLGGIPELIEEGKTGELLPAGDVELWTKTIRNLWEDKHKLKEYADNCKGASFYTVEQYCDILLSKMEHLLK